MRILGIETSCDETAAAVVDGDRRILSSVVLSQLDDHAPFGGVVPEIAARAHLAALDGIVARALAEAEVGLGDLDGVAATAGPGLIGGIMVGMMTAKALAAAAGRPFLAINHLEGHALTARLTDGIPFPYLLLLVSGGHCQLLIVEGVGRYRRIGTTIDDAVGEAFDKGAKMMGLGYPGGPAVERWAARARDPARFSLPRPMVGRAGSDFSFSGLKTALGQRLSTLSTDAQGAYAAADIADLCHALQMAITDCLADRTANAIDIFRASCSGDGAHLVVAGGVAANATIRERLFELATSSGLRFVAPPLGLCTDNAAMIAWAGVERLGLGLIDGLDFAARPRWPLDPQAAPARGAGVKA